MLNHLEFPTALRVVALASVSLIAGCADADNPSGGPTPAVAAATTQDDAVRQARTVDLPSLGNADRAVLSSEGKTVEINDAARIRRLARALEPAAAPPSAGEIATTVRFYQGPTLLREIWVYQDGEWGFRRPGTSWTTGHGDELARLIQQELAGVPAAR